MYCVTVEQNEMGGCRTHVSRGDTIKLSGHRTRVSRGDTIKLSGRRTHVLCGDTFKPLCHWHTKKTKKMRERDAARLCRSVAVVSVWKIWPQASDALSETKRARDMNLKCDWLKFS